MLKSIDVYSIEAQIGIFSNIPAEEPDRQSENVLEYEYTKSIWFLLVDKSNAIASFLKLPVQNSHHTHNSKVHMLTLVRPVAWCLQRQPLQVVLNG